MDLYPFRASVGMWSAKYWSVTVISPEWESFCNQDTITITVVFNYSEDISRNLDVFPCNPVVSFFLYQRCTDISKTAGAVTGPPYWSRTVRNAFAILTELQPFRSVGLHDVLPNPLAQDKFRALLSFSGLQSLLTRRFLRF